jgi:hypothetical protein
MLLHDFLVKRTQLRSMLSMILDAMLLASFSCLVYVLLGGELRWKTPLFRVTLANFKAPLVAVALTIIIKGVLGLKRGILAFISYKLCVFLSTLSLDFYRFWIKIWQTFINNIFNISCALISLICCLVIIESYLRYFPHTLPHVLGNHLASGYHTGISGIYQDNSRMKVHLMRPNYKKLMYFNGYYWHHETDSMGFRNPINRSSAEIILLGDSMIYGHGVEETSTVRHYLESILQMSVVNLGIQGISIHEEYQVLKTFGVNLHPRFVFLFFLVNDIRGLAETLNDEEMKKFLSLPIDDHESPYFEIPENTDWPDGLPAYLKEIYVIKSIDFFIRYIQTYLLGNANAFENTWQDQTFFEKNPRFLLAMKFHLYALRKIQNIAERHGFRFVNVFIYTGVSYPDPESSYEDILEN